MIRMVHFATRRALIPLVRSYNVDPDIYWTWMRAPAWLRKMWDVATREYGRQRVQRSAKPFQWWRYFHNCPPMPKCINIVTPGLGDRVAHYRRFSYRKQVSQSA